MSVLDGKEVRGQNLGEGEALLMRSLCVYGGGGGTLPKRTFWGTPLAMTSRLILQPPASRRSLTRGLLTHFSSFLIP